MKNYFLIIIICVIGFVASCDKVVDSCEEEKYASSVVFDFPDSLQMGTTHELKIQYIIENSCGSFVEFEDTVIGDVVEVRIKTLYEGCNCTLEFAQEEKFYQLRQDSAGSYQYKFWINETDFDTYWLEVYQ
jgi:hypothetical protein